MRLSRFLPLLFLVLAASARPAFADATLFLGTTLTPSSHTTKGFALGAGLVIVGVEFEYANTAEDTLKALPSIRTGMGNVYAQTPIAIAGMKFYATTGAGGYREKLGTTHQETNIAFNTGGGVKITLIGPLKARVDYRVFKLRGAPLYSVVHRIYAGVNLSF
jgi:opacity protein-like surface antigen